MIQYNYSVLIRYLNLQTMTLLTSTQPSSALMLDNNYGISILKEKQLLVRQKIFLIR